MEKNEKFRMRRYSKKTATNEGASARTWLTPFLVKSELMLFKQIPCIKTYILIYSLLYLPIVLASKITFYMFVYVANSIDKCLVQERG